MTPWSGKWALVTGASAGIGTALAEELARGGTNLVLTARRRERLEELAQKLATSHKIQTRIFVADLAEADAPEKIFQFTKEQGIEIELLINNAGFGAYGEFPTVEPRRLTGNGSGKLLRRRSSDAALSAGNGGAAPWRRPDSRIDSSVPKCAVHFDLRCNQSLRSAFRGRTSGRDETLRRPRLRAVPRIDGVGICGCRWPNAYRRHKSESRNCRKSGANGIACARSRQELCHFRHGELSRSARPKACLTALRSACRRPHVQAARKIMIPENFLQNTLTSGQRTVIDPIVFD